MIKHVIGKLLKGLGTGNFLVVLFLKIKTLQYYERDLHDLWKKFKDSKVCTYWVNLGKNELLLKFTEH